MAITYQALSCPECSNTSPSLSLGVMPGLFISLRVAGDLGPSGTLGAQKRQEFYQGHTGCAKAVWSCHQVHSQAVLLVAQGTNALLYSPHQCHNIAAMDFTSLFDHSGQIEADGIITDQSICLGVTAADCLPIAIRWGPWKALLHSGWQGTGILKVALQALSTVADSNNLQIVFCPSIAALDYPVPPERARQFSATFGPKAVISGADAQPCLDIVAANLGILEQWQTEHPGLAINLDHYTDSTVHHQCLQSYRRDGPAFGRSLICLD